jgi:hypothetical protein
LALVSLFSNRSIFSAGYVISAFFVGSGGYCYYRASQEEAVATALEANPPVSVEQAHQRVNNGPSYLHVSAKTDGKTHETKHGRRQALVAHTEVTTSCFLRYEEPLLMLLCCFVFFIQTIKEYEEKTSHSSTSHGFTTTSHSWTKKASLLNTDIDGDDFYLVDRNATYLNAKVCVRVPVQSVDISALYSPPSSYFVACKFVVFLSWH